MYPTSMLDDANRLAEVPGARRLHLWVLCVEIARESLACASLVHRMSMSMSTNTTAISAQGDVKASRGVAEAVAIFIQRSRSAARRAPDPDARAQTLAKA